MTTVNKLIEILKRHAKDGHGDAKIVFAESEFDWTTVLKIIIDESSPDESIEIKIIE